MKKILVTTDLSTNSKAGMRFAIRLAEQGKYDLTFFHVYNVSKSSTMSDESFKVYELNEVSKIERNLQEFVKDVYQSIGETSIKATCVVRSGVLSESVIIGMAQRNKYDLICLSTSGAGKLKQMLGSTTSYLIMNSSVPVVVVPSTFKATNITSVLYASDLLKLKNELKKVVNFAKPLNAKVELLHFTSPLETMTDSNIIETAVKHFSKYNIKLHLEKESIEETLTSKILSAIKKMNPSILVMFTEQNRTLFQKIFIASNSERYSFHSKVPMLVFSKS